MIAGARILLTTDAVGGVWTYTIDLADALGRAGAVVKVVTLGPRPDKGQLAETARRRIDILATDLPLEWLAADADAVLAAGEAVAAEAGAWGADLVHLHSPALAATARFPCPVVVVHHSCVATWRRAMGFGEPAAGEIWQAALIGDGLRRADLVLVPTTAHGALVADVYALSTPPRTVHNGRAAAADEGDDAGAMSEEVFASGRLWDAAKNFVALDRAAASFAWPVRVAGATAGPNGGEVTFARIEPLGHLRGTDVRRRLAGRPIFVSPAHYEPFGLGVLEAAQAGCALVLNDIATFRELWAGAALLVDADDPLALGDAIRTLILDGERRRTLGRAALARSSRYTIEAMARETVQAFGATAPPRATEPA